MLCYFTYISVRHAAEPLLENQKLAYKTYVSFLLLVRALPDLELFNFQLSSNQFSI